MKMASKDHLTDDDETDEDGDAFDEHDEDGHVVEENDENSEQGSSF